MALDNYTALVSSIGNWLGRSDLSAQIGDAIILFETEINRDIRVLDMMAKATITTVGGTNSYATPSDFLEIYNIEGTGFPRSLEFLTLAAMISRFNSYDSGPPKAVTIDVGDELLFAPNVDAAYTFALRYYAKVPPLAQNSTNWLLTKAPDAYLFGALSYLQSYVSNDEQYATFTAQKARALDSLKMADERQRVSGPALRPQVQGMTP